MLSWNDGKGWSVPVRKNFFQILDESICLRCLNDEIFHLLLPVIVPRETAARIKIAQPS